MGFIVRRIPFAKGMFADENGKSDFDYFAYFEEKDLGKIKESFSTPGEALRDGSKMIYHNREGSIFIHIVEGVNPDMVRKIWDTPKSQEESDSISVRYLYTSNTQKEALQWLSKNLPFVSSRFGVNVFMEKFNDENTKE